MDTILMGRKTYAFAAGKSGPKMKTKPAMRTYVFSRTLATIDDPGVELVKEDAVEFVRKLKARPGGAMFAAGSWIASG